MRCSCCDSEAEHRACHPCFILFSSCSCLWWAAFTAFVGVAMVWLACTGFCILANPFYWAGCEPRLAPLDI
jgi:hypothetical protein